MSPGDGATTARSPTATSTESDRHRIMVPWSRISCFILPVFGILLLNLRDMLDQTLLAPYWLSLKLRHAMFDHGIRKSYPCEVPSICIGNITAGGTGKTPHTEMILDLLLESDEWAYRNIAVLSRGHKRSSRGFQQVLRDGTADFCGDEPLQIKKRHMGVTVAVDRNRNEGCRFLCHPDLLQTEKKGRRCQHKDFPAADLIVLDDAYQYRNLKAHVNIVLVDWNRPINKDHLLPLGRLRDLPERIYKADMIIVTKCPVYMEDWEKTQWVKTLGVNGYNSESCEGVNKEGKTVKVFFTCIEYQPLEPVFEELGDNRFIYSQKLVLFTGIAKDTPLRMYLSDKYKIVRRFNFPDHHKYSNTDIKRIVSASVANPTAVVVSTEKDSQRILDCKKVPENLRTRLFQIPIKVVFLSENEKEIFRATLLQSLREFHSEPAQTPHE